MKKSMQLETTVRLDNFYASEYPVSLRVVNDCLEFTDPWTKQTLTAESLDDLLRQVEDTRRAKRDGRISALLAIVKASTSPWPVNPGDSLMYKDMEDKPLASVMCVSEPHQAYLVQLYRLPAFLSAPFAARSKEHMVSILDAMRLQLRSATNEVAPEVTRAFHEFESEL